MNSNVMIMVIAIVLIVSIAGLLKARMGIRKDMWGNEVKAGDDSETVQSRAEEV